MPRVYASRVAEAELAELLGSLSDRLSYAYEETAVAGRWTRFAGAPAADAVRGRLFGATCEVQFQRGSDGLAVQVCSDEPVPAAAGAASLDLGDCDVDAVTYVLWGEHAPGADAWHEPGYPQRWQYPVDGTPRRVGVGALEYRDRTTGELHFLRYTTLAAVEDEG
jgi:hypothetical protein